MRDIGQNNGVEFEVLDDAVDPGHLFQVEALAYLVALARAEFPVDPVEHPQYHYFRRLLATQEFR